MSVKIRKSLVATALFGACALASNNVMADRLNSIHAAETAIHKAAKKSQDKIDSIYEQTQELVVQYNATVDATEIRKEYNDYLSNLVSDQNESIASLQQQIKEVEETKKNVVPLMIRMIDKLEQFIKADVPFDVEKRLARVANLRNLLSDSNVTTSEQYRQVLDAYLVEQQYSSTIPAWQGTLKFEGAEIAVDFARVGRVVYVAQSLDLKNAWVWDNSARSWTALGDEYLNPVKSLIRMSRKQASLDLVKLPVFGAE